LLPPAALSSGVLAAQDMAGNWQGSLQAGGRELRIVVKVTKANDALKAVMYSIDQGGPVLPASAFTLQGSTVKMSIPGIGGSYEGKLDADGASMTGNWTQGPNPIALNLKRATAENAWAIPEPPPPPKPMAADATPVVRFESLRYARRVDLSLGGRFAAELDANLREAAPLAAAAYAAMRDQDGLELALTTCNALGVPVAQR